MANKFSQFLDEHKIDRRRLLAISRRIERLRPEDRALKLQKRQSKSGAGAAEGSEGEAQAPAKPRSGRPVTPRLLARAEAGNKVSGPAKQRLLRAVNQILGQKKQDTVDLPALF